MAALLISHPAVWKAPLEAEHTVQHQEESAFGVRRRPQPRMVHVVRSASLHGGYSGKATAAEEASAAAARMASTV